MKAKFGINDKLKLKKDRTFTRTFPMAGYSKNRSVGEIDKVHMRAGSVANVFKIYETSVGAAKPSYDVDFGELKVHLSEKELLEPVDTL